MLEKTKEPGYFNEFDKHCNKVLVQYYYLKMFLNIIFSQFNLLSKTVREHESPAKKDVWV